MAVFGKCRIPYPRMRIPVFPSPCPCFLACEQGMYAHFEKNEQSQLKSVSIKTCGKFGQSHEQGLYAHFSLPVVQYQ